MCFVFIWEKRATYASYTMNWVVFTTKIKNCLLRVTNWVFKWSTLRFACEGKIVVGKISLTIINTTTTHNGLKPPSHRSWLFVRNTVASLPSNLCQAQCHMCLVMPVVIRLARKMILLVSPLMNGCCWFCVVFLVAFGFGSRKGERLFIWKQRGELHNVWPECWHRLSAVGIETHLWTTVVQVQVSGLDRLHWS